MTKVIVLSALLALMSASSALAACPTSVPGTASEAIEANEQRILCLQQEVDRSSRQRQLELDLRANQNAIQDLRIQRRFDQLPRIPAPDPFARPQPFVPN